MSQHVDVRFELERRRRHEEFERRVRATTGHYLERYRQLLADMRAQDLDGYVPHEMAALDRRLDRIESLLVHDPAAARTESMAIAAAVQGLPHVARAARSAAVDAEIAYQRKRQAAQEQARQDLEEAWRSRLAQWPDVLARNLAFDALAALRKSLFTKNGDVSIQTVTAALDELQQEYESKASDFRREQAEATRQQAQEEVIAAELARVEAVHALVPEQTPGIRAMLGNVVTLPADAFSERLAAATGSLDDAVVDESCRRAVVLAVRQSLQDAGFICEAPRRLRDGGQDEVVIRARRPAGAEAEFRVKLSGDMRYSFDRYEGSACKKDVATVLPRLQDIYGVKLSDERVIWENPDDLQKGSRPRAGDLTENKK